MRTIKQNRWGTAQQISKELREDASLISGALTRQHLNELADAIDALAKPSQSIQEAAQSAAEKIARDTDTASFQGNGPRFVFEEYINEVRETILSHLAPHCGVNPGLLKACKTVESDWPVWLGTPKQKEFLDSLRAAIAAAEAVQSQEKGTK